MIKLPAAAPVMRQRIDLGFGCPVSQSSSYTSELTPSSLRPALHAGGISFHTALEEGPWFTIDLQHLRVIGEITIWNREGAHYLSERAVPLSVLVSEDSESWKEVSTTNEIFLGRRAGRPLVFTYPFGVNARFIKIMARNNTYLHLDYVEIVQLAPNIQYGEIADLKRTVEGRVVCHYRFHHDNGLFANFSAILADLISISKARIAVEAVDVSDGFRFFKTNQNENVMQAFCSPIDGDLIDLCAGISFVAEQVHSEYKCLPLEPLRRIIAVAFQPSFYVRFMMSQMISSSGIIPENTVAMVYRGTDKRHEVRLASINDYITLCRRILDQHPDYEVFIQTDQVQVRDTVLAAFPSARFFCELPVTNGETAIHNLSIDEIGMCREEFAQRIIAAALILSHCAYIINHTGNMGAWIALYRGASEGLYQFDSGGMLVEP
jgi:hypothetical protein